MNYKLLLVISQIGDVREDITGKDIKSSDRLPQLEEKVSLREGDDPFGCRNYKVIFRKLPLFGEEYGGIPSIGLIPLEASRLDMYVG